MRDSAGQVLAGWTVAAPAHGGPAERECIRHLKLLGASASPPTGEADRDSLVLTADAALDGGTDSIEAAIRWPSPAAGASPAGAEALTQALSGLMTVHGREHGRPRRLGIDVVSTAAGVLATQGVLASLIAQRRGRAVAAVEVSATLAGAWFIAHHFTAATSGDPWKPPVAGDAPGPPFATSEGEWVELEVLSAEDWHAFWRRLGVEDPQVDLAWLSFAFRHNTAVCRLPIVLHEATARHTVGELWAVAAACGVAVSRLRSYNEVLADLGWQPGAGGPLTVPPPWRVEADRGRDVHGAFPSIDSDSAPLAGMRVLEITSRVQGPLAGLLLRMLGAEVTRIEAPGGDPSRDMPPLAGTQGSAFLAYNRGKTPVEIDYKSKAGRRAILELAARSDVFLHNWRPGRGEALGLDPATLRRCNSRLICAHASGWSDSHATLPRIATDYLVQAHSGCAYGLVPADEPPRPSRVTIVDVIGALVATEGALAALCLRERSGRGGCVATSLQSSAIALQASLLEAVAAGRHRGRARWGPLDQPVQTADGHLMLAGGDEESRRRLHRLCRLPSRPTRGPVQEQIIVRALLARSAREWEAVFRESGIPCATVPDDLRAIPAQPETEAVLEAVEGGCRAPCPPWRFES